MICIETIKKRKTTYGNNFPEIAKLQDWEILIFAVIISLLTVLVVIK